MDESADPRVVFQDVAVIEIGPREVICATGADRIAFLHRLVTGQVETLGPGRGGRSLLLDLKGHVVSDMHLFVRADEVRLVVAAGQGEPTASALIRYAIMDDFAVTPETGLGLLTVAGPQAPRRLAAAGLAVPDDFFERPLWSHQDASWDGGGPFWIARARNCGADTVWVFAAEDERATLQARLASAGVLRLDAGVTEALRIKSGEPRFGAEITADYFPMEVGLNEAIDYSKGCYLGQEPIVRIRDRGHINWRLVGLRLRGEVVPAAGDTLESDEKPRAGRVTSAGRLPGEPPVALALLHVSVGVGTEIRVRHGEAMLMAQVVAL